MNNPRITESIPTGAWRLVDQLPLSRVVEVVAVGALDVVVFALPTPVIVAAVPEVRASAAVEIPGASIRVVGVSPAAVADGRIKVD